MRAWYGRERMQDDVSELLPVIYDQLRKIAGSYLRGQQGHTLQTTAVVHEAFLRLARKDGAAFQDRNHFLAVASIAMRQVLIDHARRKTTQKRGGGQRAITLDGPVQLGDAEGAAVDMLALDAALNRLADLAPRQARVVELMFFGGLTAEEAAQALGVSLRLVEKEWRRARAWLQQELEEQP
jgi:RNA polymerase sigma factor (TIGR02999 family)